MSRSFWIKLSTITLFCASLLITTKTTQARSSCQRKRQRCLTRCLIQSKRKTRTCRRDNLNRRNRCIRKAHKEGRKCFRRASCPKAAVCYRECGASSSPQKCYVKKGCSTLQASCYASCQIPIGETLKQCLQTTQTAKKTCQESSTSTQETCRSSCTTCE